MLRKLHLFAFLFSLGLHEMAAYGRGLGDQNFLGNVFANNFVAAGTSPWVDVTSPQYGAVSGQDSTAAFTKAEVVAGNGGTLFVPPGTFLLNNWTPTKDRIKVQGAGMGSTVLKATGGATAVLTLRSLQQCSFSDIRFDGNSSASIGTIITTDGATGSFAHLFIHCWWDACSTCVQVPSGGAVNEADQNTWINCWFTNSTTGFDITSPNGQGQVCINPRFGTLTTGVRLAASGAQFTAFGGQFNNCATGILFPSACNQLGLYNVIFESGSPAVDIDGTSAWPSMGVTLDGCILQGSTATIKYAQPSGKLVARNCLFNTGNIDATGGTTFTFIDLGCAFGGGAGIVNFNTSNRHVTPTGSRLFNGPTSISNGIGNTALTNGDITTISANWGAGATGTLVGTDARFRATITAAGTPAANPTIVVTFKDGAYQAGANPRAVVSRGDGNAPTTGFWTVQTMGTTTITLAFIGTPVAGNAYIVDCIVSG